MSKYYWQTKKNGISDLFGAGSVCNRIEQSQFEYPVLVEVEDDPFGPPIEMGVVFVKINLNSLEIELGGYPWYEDEGKYDTSKYFTLNTTANGFRVVVKEDE